jgi:hypothetical protein
MWSPERQGHLGGKFSAATIGEAVTVKVSFTSPLDRLWLSIPDGRCQGSIESKISHSLRGRERKWKDHVHSTT